MWHAPRFPGRILLSARDRPPSGSRRSPHRRRPAVFRLECLEDRTVLSTVTSLGDSGPGTLRDAIANAAPGEIIDFAPKLHGTITLTSGQLGITQNLNIVGPGANGLTISGNDDSRVFDINPATTVTISGLTITDGKADVNAPSVHSLGGGILNQGDLTLKDVVVSYNWAVGAANDTITVNGFKLTGNGLGGGVANLSILNVSDSTFEYNQARGASGSRYDLGNTLPGGAFGGGLANVGLATATVTDSQFTSNLAQAGNGCSNTNPSGIAGDAAGGAIVNMALKGPGFNGLATLRRAVDGNLPKTELSCPPQ
jgi:hypothetical protein